MTEDGQPQAGGYVRLYRSLLDHPAFNDVQEAMAFAWWIMLARWKPCVERIDGQTVHLDRGDLPMSARFMAEQFGWSKSRAHRFIQRTESELMVTQKRDRARDGRRDTSTTILTICNYDKYQPLGSDDGTPPETPLGTVAGQQRDSSGTNKKEGKESKKEIYTDDFVRFWSAYPSRHPHQNPKRPAATAFHAAVRKGNSADTIIAGALSYAAYCRDNRTDQAYIAQAVTWLRQARWEQQADAHSLPFQTSRPSRAAI